MFNLAEMYWDWLARFEAGKVRRKKFKKYKRKAFGKSQNETACLEMDKLWEECIDSGVIASVAKEHTCSATFNNGWSVNFWTANKVYGYCNSGWSYFTKPDASKVSMNNPPSIYMCYYIIDKVENFRKID